MVNVAVKSITELELHASLTEGVSVAAILDKVCWGSISEYFSDVLEELSQQDAELNIVKINKDDAKGLIEKYELSELPSTLLFVGNKFKEKIEGYMESEDIEDIMDNYK